MLLDQAIEFIISHEVDIENDEEQYVAGKPPGQYIWDFSADIHPFFMRPFYNFKITFYKGNLNNVYASANVTGNITVRIP